MQPDIHANVAHDMACIIGGVRLCACNDNRPYMHNPPRTRHQVVGTANCRKRLAILVGEFLDPMNSDIGDAMAIDTEGSAANACERLVSKRTRDALPAVRSCGPIP
jgi:hypothetical protein